MLPAHLKDKIDALLHGQGAKDLSRSATRVSDKYRDRERSAFAIESDQEALAYVVTRMPATYAAAQNVFERLLEMRDDFLPNTMLDIGAGPGTVAFAAQERWNTTSVDLVEPNKFLSQLGHNLSTDMNAHWINSAVQNFDFAERKYDLVSAGYVFNEIGNRADLIAKLWGATEDILVLIEPGTPVGYQVIAEARSQLIKLGAHILAPCPHESTCPLYATREVRWCHFNVRVERSRMHRQIKPDASLGYEDEKFSYLIAQRKPISNRISFRAIGHVHGQKVISVEVCRSDGTSAVVQMSKRDPAYKQVRKMAWGDSFDHEK